MIFPERKKESRASTQTSAKERHLDGNTYDQSGSIHIFVHFLCCQPASVTITCWCTQYHHKGYEPVPALWREGRLLLLELSRTSTIVGAGFSNAGVCCVVTGVVAVVLVVVALVVVVVVVAVVAGSPVAALGWATVPSMVSRTISDPPSSDWFSVMWWTVKDLAAGSES